MCCPPGSLIVCLLGDTTFLDCQSWCSTMRVSPSGRWVGGLPSESRDLGGHVSAPLFWLILLKVRLPRCCKFPWQSFIFFNFFYFWLEENCFTMLHWISAIQQRESAIMVHVSCLSLPSLHPSPPGHHACNKKPTYHNCRVTPDHWN